MKRKKEVHFLDIYLKSNLVGSLIEQTTGAMEFKYNDKWLQSPKSMPISQSLPLSTQIYRGDEVKSFFNNLLPDSDQVRKKMAERLGAESSSDFDILNAIGKDCVGAFQFLPQNSPPPKNEEVTGKKISPTVIANILKNLPVMPLGNDPAMDFRLSIAGQQDKTALLKQNSSWYIPKGVTPTSHILKVAMGELPSGIDLSTSIENEWLCLQIIRRLGLDVTEAKIKTFKDQKCLLVTRFDRNWIEENKILERIPQEDLCQALGYSSTKKYESDGGPGITEIMGFLLASDDPKKDRQSFLRTQIAFCLLGATDGHAKNFSIFHTQSGFHLTPLYDILSVYPAWKKREIRRNKMKLAMAVGDHRHYKLYEIKRRHWQQTAKACGISSDVLEDIIKDLINKTKDILNRGIKLPKDFPDWIYGSIMEELEKALSRLETP